MLMSEDSESTLTKSDTALTFTLEVSNLVSKFL